jgi:GT2 family glycosyltransferase/glycosyltransferase involved in cell wall biosynthesis
MAPFNNGIWAQPTAEDQQKFAAQISTKVVNELVPTQEMVQAITEKMEGPPVLPRVDLTPAIERVRGAVDIVIPIYGSLHVVKPCIESVLKHTNWPFHLILVDDASPDEAVRDYLKALEGPKYDRPKMEISILFNQVNRGFPATVNRGVAHGDGEYICILNSDTLVTPGWLTRQLVALEADPKNVITNPCTNNTALIQVPMYNGKSYRDMAVALSQSPNTPTHNEIMPTGFCFTMRRKLWDEVGPFDEAFGSGYGEETSFWMNALKQTDEKGILLNNRAVIADDAFVFHERGSSFAQLGEDKHMGMRRIGNERFHKLHPDFKEWSKGFVADDAINHVRRGLDRSIFPTDYKGNVCWVVKSAASCGGMNFIADIVNELIERGYNAQVCVIPDQYDPEMEGRLPVTSHLRTSPHLFKSREEFVQTFTSRVFTTGLVFAAVSELSQAVRLLADQNKGLKGANHVQSYDVDLARLLGREDLVPAILEAYKALPNVCSSGWIARELKAQGAAVTGVILPGVNPDLFHPRRVSKDERKTIAVLMNTDYGVIKGNDWAAQFLKELEPTKHANVRVIAIGPTALDIRGVTCLGTLPQSKMAEILGSQVDVLVDPAVIHSYGLPVLEALYSGAAAVCRPNKGVDEYKEVWNDRVAVTDDPRQAARDALHFLTGAHVPAALPGITTNRTQAINDFIEHIFPGNKQATFKIEMVTPHMRKHGGPTTLVTAAKQLKRLGHDVAVSMIYTDWNPEVLKTARPLPVRTNWKLVQDDLNVVIINSDNPFAEEIMKARPGAKFVMYKLSHNPRFQKTENDNLNLPWDHIMTSTNWLREACITPMAGWTHQAWPEDKVSVVGWYHYGHSMFAMNPANRTYGSAMAGFKLGTLIHDHPLKGTFDAMAGINGLKRKYNQFFHAAGFGEIKANVPDWMQYFRSADRKTLADAFQQLDVWLGASHSEGLGRLALEAMSAGVAVVTTDTGAEFLRHEENCLLYPVGNPQKGAETVDRLVNDQALFTKIVVNGFRTAENAANSDNFQHNLNVVLRRVMQ